MVVLVQVQLALPPAVVISRHSPNFIGYLADSFGFFGVLWFWFRFLKTKLG